MNLPAALWAGLLSAIGALPKLLKRKLFVVQYRGLDGVWRKKSKPMSKRQCRREIQKLIKTGDFAADRLEVWRDGVDPNKGTKE